MVNWWIVGVALVLGVYILVKKFKETVNVLDEPDEEEETEEEFKEIEKDVFVCPGCGSDWHTKEEADECCGEEGEDENMGEYNLLVSGINKDMTLSNLTKEKGKELYDKFVNAYKAGETKLEIGQRFLQLDAELDYIELTNEEGETEDEIGFEIEYNNRDE